MTCCHVILFHSSAALGVKLKDDSFPKDDFERVKGFLEVQWDRIAPYPFCEILVHYELSILCGFLNACLLAERVHRDVLCLSLN